MSDEPINSKTTARSLHKSSRHLDKNTSKGKYKKQEAAEYRKKKQLENEREQDPEYQAQQLEKEESDGSNTTTSSSAGGRSKYSKRLLVKQSTQSIDDLNDLYDKSNNYLDMQELLDSTFDFIPKNDDDDSLDVNNNNTIDKKQRQLQQQIQQQSEINLTEIERLLLSFSIPERLNIDSKYFNDVNIDKPSNPIVSLSRKSNRHLKQQQQQNTKNNTDNENDNEINNNNNNDDVTISILKSTKPLSSSEPTVVKQEGKEDEAEQEQDETNGDNEENETDQSNNENVLKSNQQQQQQTNQNQSLEDWLDTII